MDVSLVICTRDRARQLERSLKAVAAIRSSLEWEVIVVDNGSSDDTQAVLERASATLPVPLRVLSQPLPGASRARNDGWRLATAEVVAFTDDDCYPSPDYVDVAAEVIREAPARGFAGGSMLLHDPTEAAVAVVEHRQRLLLERRTYVPIGLVSGGCMAFRREALESIGGFDEELGAGTRFPGEDADAAVRASFAGWEGVQEPRLVVRHHHGREPGAETTRYLHSYDYGRGAVFAKWVRDPALRRPIARAWLRLIAWRLRRGQLGVLAREGRGACAYWLRRRRGSPAAAPRRPV